jgi:sarcosine oxidase subunit alpha
VRTYINRFAVRPGDAAAIFTNNDDGYHAAIDLHRAGALVHAIVDPRRNGQGPVREQAEALGIEVQAGAVIVRTHGFNALSGAESMEIDDAGNVVGSPRYIPCDLLAISGGWSPNVHLHSHAGGRLQYDPVIAAFVPGDSRQAEMPIGSASGVFGLGDVLRDGLDAGAEAAEICGFRSTDRKPTPTPEVKTVPTYRMM